FPNSGDLGIPKLRFPEFGIEKWETKRLGEIANFTKGKGISKSDIDENGETECIRYGELYTFYEEVISEIKSKTNTDISSLVLSEANDVIIPASGETQIDIATASCVLKPGVALGGDLNIIKTKNNGVFLSYYLNSKKKLEIAKLSQGISVVHLYSSQLALLNLKLPPLEEQNKLANFLSLLNSRIQTQKKI
ncbi:restriction endonuclease subunit S, partial [Chryseobacterium cucumeris]